MNILNEYNINPILIKNQIFYPNLKIVNDVLIP